MSIECDRVGGINLSQGVCDTEVPGPVRAAAKSAIDAGQNSYTRYDGTDELRRAVARKLDTYNGVQANPDTEITISAGSTGAFYCACLALLNPGDEVILFEPYYGYHVNTLLAVGAVPTFVSTAPPNWSFSLSDLESVVTPRTRGIMINTPGNPTGKVFDRAELEQVAAFVLRHDLILFTDEIYEYFVYDDRSHVSPASIREVADRTVTISGFSKTFSITGWRIGYSVANPEWAQMIGYMNDLVYVCAPAPLQAGIADGLKGLSPTYYAEMRQEYLSKRDLLCSALADAGLTPFVPQGAYYVLADVSSIRGRSSKERAMALLAQTGVAGVPGEAFFHDGGGEHLIRFCFAKTDSDLTEACRRLRAL